MRTMRKIAATAIAAAALLTLTNTGMTGADPVARKDTAQSRSIIADIGPRPAGLAPAKGERVVPAGLSADVQAKLAGPFYIVNAGTGRCLDAHYDDGGGNGNRVGLWDCNNGITEQWYTYDNGSSGSYWMTIINARTGRSLDYPASSGGRTGMAHAVREADQPGAHQGRAEHHRLRHR